MLLSGVAAGVAAHLGLRPGGVRVLFVVLALCGGAGVLLYVWLWAFVPLAGEARSAERAVDRPSDRDAGAIVERAVPVALVLVGVAGVAAAVAVLVGRTPANGHPLVPGIVESVLAGAGAVAWSLVGDRRDPRYNERYARVVRTTAGCVLIGEGVLLLPSQPSPPTAVSALLVLLLGVVVLLLPRAVAWWSGVLAERSAREREAQRAEIAAHLHDSVLQTLAIIQNRAGPQSEIARLARAQERELRDWLFAGTDPFAGDVATELRGIAAALELDHGVRFEVVTVGDVQAIANGPLVAAAREAMLNAARHAGGDVSVYVEATVESVDVFVRDRGPGFDPERVPESRIGIRESIVGRMERAGGRATVRSGPEGTEVHLSADRSAT